MTDVPEAPQCLYAQKLPDDERVQLVLGQLTGVKSALGLLSSPAGPRPGFSTTSATGCAAASASTPPGHRDHRLPEREGRRDRQPGHPRLGGGKRWIVERSLSWLMRARRNARDYERLPEHAEAHITWANITLMTRRLTRGSARRAASELFPLLWSGL